MNKEEFSLKYPQKFTVRYCFGNSTLNENGSWRQRTIFYPAPCYVLQEHKSYDEFGGVKEYARVLVQWKTVAMLENRPPIEEVEITKENYKKLILEKIIEVDKVFDTYEECKIEAEKINDKNLAQERQEALYSGESIGDGLLKAEIVTTARKNEHSKVMSAADELYAKMTNSKTTKVCPAVERTKEILAERRNNENPTSGGEGR